MASGNVRSALQAMLVLSVLTPSLTLSVSVIEKRAGIIPTLPGAWTSLGCYADVGRTLPVAAYDNTTTNTIENCIAYCSTAGYPYAGTEYSSQCWCGNSVAPAAQPVPDGCQMTCSANSTEACGGPDQLNLFWSGQSGPQTNPGPGLWSFLGCYTEGLTGRLLPNGVDTTGGAAAMTVALCVSACEAAGYTLAGAEYSQECWCGNTLSNGGTIAPVSDCNILCRGNGSEFCGGTSRLDVYNFNGTFTAPTGTTTTVATTTASPTSIPTAGPYTYYGCQTEGTFSRALAAKTTSSDTMTIETCEAFCTGYAYFGTEYGRECYCGNSFSAGSVAAPATDCNVLCAGDVTEYCGGGSRLSVYQRNSNGTTTTTTATTSAPTSIPTGWTSQGCWVDGAYGRILGKQIPDSDANTVELCVNTCIGLDSGYTVAGVEYGVQCFCDSAIQNGAVVAPSTDCDMPCQGNFNEFCGAGNRMNIYAIGTPVVNPAPTGV